jgi:hypothetical protein
MTKLALIAAALLGSATQIASAGGGHYQQQYYNNHQQQYHNVQVTPVVRHQTRQECHSFGASRHCHNYRVAVLQVADNCHAHNGRGAQRNFDRSFDAPQGRLHCHQGSRRSHIQQRSYFQQRPQHHANDFVGQHKRPLTLAEQIDADGRGPAD